VNNRSHRLLGEIEAGALDQKTPIGDLLRRVIALGGQAGSTELRDWATHELRGYGPGDKLPPYRKIVAPLQLDMNNMAYILRGQTISPLELPELAHDAITNDVALRFGIAEIEQLARRCEPGGVVKLSPPGSQELVALMNAEEHVNGHVHCLYWSVSPVVLEGVVEQVRTTLTAMTAEIRAEMPDGGGVISPAVADNALTVAVTGKRNKVSFANAQGANEMTPPTEEKPSHWVRIAAAVVVGVLTIAGVFFAIMQAQGWRF
jgi:hypothetical protein